MPQNTDDRKRGKYRTALILLITVVGMFIIVIVKNWK